MKEFKIAFVFNGKIFYYGFNGNIPFLTLEIAGAYVFADKYYGTDKRRKEEAERLKKYFFNDGDVKSLVLE